MRKSIDKSTGQPPSIADENLVGDVDDVSTEIDPVAQRRLVRKLDWTIMPIVFIMYFFNAIDRSNLGNAKTDGMDRDLGFTGNQYSILVMVFYVPFCGLCLPANLVTRKYQPAYFLSGFMFCWGIMATVCAACKNFAQMLAVRILLGIAEAGFAPCIMFYMTTFWTRGELATRFAIWYTATVASGAFSGLISYGVFQIKNGLYGWQYLFLIEGALTTTVSIFAFFVLPKNPQTCRWLTEDEKRFSTIRLRADSSVHVNSAWSFSEGMEPFRDWKVYLWSVIGLCYGTSGAAVGSFLPQIVGLLGYDTLKTNLATVAPNLVGAIILFCIARSSDHFRERSGHLLFSLGVTFVGWVVLLALNPIEHVGVAYFACFLLCGGAMTPTVLFHAWHNSNIPTENGRIYVTSFLTGAANAGGIIAGNAFRSQDAPRYIPFLATAAAFEGAGMVLILAFRCWMMADNRRKDKTLGRRMKTADVNTSEISEGTRDVKWRWFL